MCSDLSFAFPGPGWPLYPGPGPSTTALCASQVPIHSSEVANLHATATQTNIPRCAAPHPQPAAALATGPAALTLSPQPTKLANPRGPVTGPSELGPSVSDPCRVLHSALSYCPKAYLVGLFEDTNLCADLTDNFSSTLCCVTLWPIMCLPRASPLYPGPGPSCCLPPPLPCPQHQLGGPSLRRAFVSVILEWAMGLRRPITGLGRLYHRVYAVYLRGARAQRTAAAPRAAQRGANVPGVPLKAPSPAQPRDLSGTDRKKNGP